MTKSKQRKSGIELLKVFAIILIIISHVNQTLGSESLYYSTDYLYDYKMASSSTQSLILVWANSYGSQGNLIFFICSAWFLLESKNVNTKKLIQIISDVWVINIIILVILIFSGKYAISTKDIIKSIFPTTFATNWYITCYVLFYLIHSILNRIIDSLTQKELLSASIIALMLYYVLGYVKNDLFFVSPLILLIVVYFAVAYEKKYMKNFCANKKKNIFILIIGASGTPVMILLTNTMGMHFSYFQDKLTRWGVNSSPFILLTAIALFNLMKNEKFTNNIINRISSLSLLIYIIHENLNRPDFTGDSKFERMESLWKRNNQKDILKKSEIKQSGWSMNIKANPRLNGHVSYPLQKNWV